MTHWLCCCVQVTIPYLKSQYGRDVIAGLVLPVRLLDVMQNCKAEHLDQQVIVLGQVKQWRL